jgi:hypothetical protein
LDQWNTFGKGEVEEAEEDEAEEDEDEVEWN